MLAGYSTIGNGSASTSNQTSALMDGYSVVDKQRKLNLSSEDRKSKASSSADSDHTRDTSADEPNYESMPSESLSDPNYSVLKSTGSESDPNYESMNHCDPNYESVKYLNLDEPPYEKLQDDDSSKAESDVPGYEVVEKTQTGHYLSNDASDVNRTTLDYQTVKGLHSDIVDDDGIVQV